MTDTWPITVWNHYDNDAPRTNNHVESHNNQVILQLSSPHPNIWKFTSFLRSEGNNVTISISRDEQTPLCVQIKSKQTKKNETTESKLKEENASKRITFSEYFKALALVFKMPVAKDSA